VLGTAYEALKNGLERLVTQSKSPRRESRLVTRRRELRSQSVAAVANLASEIGRVAATYRGHCSSSEAPPLPAAARVSNESDPWLQETQLTQLLVIPLMPTSTMWRGQREALHHSLNLGESST